MFSAEESKGRVYTVREALHSMCEKGIEIGIIQKTPVSMMIGILQSVAETAGGDDVWIEFYKHNTYQNTPMVRYIVNFSVPGGSSAGYRWQRSIPVK